jgi:cytochrome c6
MKEFFIKLLKKCLYTIIIISNIKKGNALEKGEILFKTNCSVCHLGGNNIIIPEKNLKGKTLEANGMNSVSAISYQILNGKNGMPAFGGRLKESEIKEIAEYVLVQSKNNFEN